MSFDMKELTTGITRQDMLKESVRLVSKWERTGLLEGLKDSPRHKAKSNMARLLESQAAQIIERLSARQAAGIVSELPSDEQADLISRLPEIEASAILDAMPAAYARGARRLLSYPSDSAGGLMITEMLSYRDNLTVGDVLE